MVIENCGSLTAWRRLENPADSKYLRDHVNGIQPLNIAKSLVKHWDRHGCRRRCSLAGRSRQGEPVPFHRDLLLRSVSTDSFPSPALLSSILRFSRISFCPSIIKIIKTIIKTQKRSSNFLQQPHSIIIMPGWDDSGAVDAGMSSILKPALNRYHPMFSPFR